MEQLLKKEIEGILIRLICLAIWDKPFDESSLSLLSKEDWEYLHQKACLQGMPAIFFDGLDKLNENYDLCQKLLIEKGAQAIKGSESRWLGQMQLALILSNTLGKKGIRMLLLKGIGLSLCYPRPKHRESNDIDIYLFGDFERGNQLAVSMLKAKVEKFSKKEDHIIIGNYAIDNHICFLWVDSKKKKELDDFLKQLLNRDKLSHFEGSDILLPPADFNLYFLLLHSYSHFMREGMSLRQMTDLACFLKKHELELDWIECLQVLQRFELRKFADATIAFIARYFEIFLSYKPNVETHILERMLADIMGNSHAVVYHKSRITSKIYIAKTAWKNRWRYDAFYEGGFWRFVLDSCL